MYSYDERIKAVKLYIQYDKSYASLFRELGYPPSSHTIKLWYKEYKQHGDLCKLSSRPASRAVISGQTGPLCLSLAGNYSPVGHFRWQSAEATSLLKSLGLIEV